MPSERHSDEAYLVDLTTGECACDGWGKHRTPCKHVLAAEIALGRMAVERMKDQL